ncbi:unnamed protein product [Trifolium pratense]|uniref:Uncharacterized protein n=1 Tax=Trifolium pratense TaxID=57577 RepID=A0ACB0LPN5_TRIPR|nr:unnamed protein product [Trifolium pratense]
MKLPGSDGVGWFDESLRKELGDGKGTSFWLDPWVDGVTLHHHFGRLFDVAVDKVISVADMIGEEGGVKFEKWNWWQELFRWEEKVLEVCKALVLGAVSFTEGEDRWRWGKSEYTVKEAYLCLRKDDSEEADWVKDVWNKSIPLKMSFPNLEASSQ